MRVVWLVASVAACTTSPTVIVSNTTAFSIALDENFIYWTSYNGLYRAPKDGDDATPTQLAPFGADNVSPVVGVALDTSSIYWAEPGTCATGANDGAIMTMSIGGGMPTALVTQQPCPASLVIDENTVYWGDSSTISSVGKAGGAVAAIASNVQRPVATALNTTFIFWTDVDGTVRSVNKAGGTESTLAANLGTGRGIAVGSDSLYFAGFNGATGSVAEVPIMGGSLVTLSTDDSAPSWVAVDSNDVYWTDTYHVFRTGFSSDVTDTIANDEYGVSAIAVDDAYIYWSDTPSTNAVSVGIKRIAK
ncbi:MAG TPA: hypothetical protein VGL61_31490 [Kofleriaceae bacterium]|jgi:hypothetical protein